MIRARIARALIAMANGIYRVAERMNPSLYELKGDFTAAQFVDFVTQPAGKFVPMRDSNVELMRTPRTPYSRKRAVGGYQPVAHDGPVLPPPRKM